MNDIKVVIIGEKDWASYQMDVDVIKNVANNLKTLKTDMMVAELGDILNTENRVHKDKEEGDYTVPNILATYIYRTMSDTEILQSQEHPATRTLMFGCFKTKKVDGKEEYCIVNGGLFAGALESEEEILSTFWTRTQKLPECQNRYVTL
ncbi:MAG: hypothetical protein ACU841_02425 [Gammaproteobacteria bacterium]